MANKLADVCLSKIAAQQHGFVKGRSTATNLLNLVNYIQEQIVLGSQTDIVYLDFSKAFDSVIHNKLIEKLHNFGIQGILLVWIKSYLTDRTQIIRVKGFVSSPVSLRSGVPRESHLGPLQFTIFINDLSSVIRNSIYYILMISRYFVA